jgi:hypothetical protein
MLKYHVVLLNGRRVIPYNAVRYNVLKSSGTLPNFLITVASLKSPVAGSPVRLKATAPR